MTHYSRNICLSNKYMEKRTGVINITFGGGGEEGSHLRGGGTR